MDVLLHITNPDAAAMAASLGSALSREGASWGCFLTDDGVKALDHAGFLKAAGSAGRVAVCEHSWDQFMAGRDCPVEIASQTINSLMMGEAARVVSL